MRQSRPATQSQPNKNKNKNINYSKQKQNPKNTIALVPKSRQVTGAKPKIVNESTGLVAKHSEYIDSLAWAATGPLVALGLSAVSNGYDLNPGNPLLFPWLAGIATNFEKYRFRKLTFRLLSRNAATVSGTYYACVDYDWDDAVPGTIAEVMASATKVSFPVWQESELHFDPRLDRSPPRYVIPIGVEPRTSYAGFFWVGTAGTSAATSVDLMVDYECELMVPQMSIYTMSSYDVNTGAQSIMYNTFTNGANNYTEFPLPNSPLVTTLNILSGLGNQLLTTKRVIPVSKILRGGLEFYNTIVKSAGNFTFSDTYPRLNVQFFDKNGNYSTILAGTNTTTGFDAVPGATSAHCTGSILGTTIPVGAAYVLPLLHSSLDPGQIAATCTTNMRVF